MLESSSETCERSAQSSSRRQTTVSTSQDDLNSYMEVVAKQANELETIRGEFELLRSELDLRLELSSELELQVGTLEKKVLAAEDEACAAARKLSNASEENKRLADQVRESN